MLRKLCILNGLLSILLLTACNPAVQPTVDHRQVATALAVQSLAATQVSGTQASAAKNTPAPTQPEPSATPETSMIYISEAAPERLRQALKLPEGYVLTEDQNQAAVKLEVQGEAQPESIPWVYALVAPFPTLQDDEGINELQKVIWSSQGPVFPIKALLIDQSTKAVLETMWGKAGPLVTTVATEDIQKKAWADPDRTTWAIIPFDQLNPSWKVLRVSDQSPVRRDFDSSRYPLTAYFGLSGDEEKIAKLTQAGLPKSNRQAELLTTVTLTGTTALVRGTASLMEGRGMDYPARDIGDWLKDTDILHISNEVAYDPKCPQPFDWVDLKFCSRPKYHQLLEDLGVDVVELTGDHFADWSVDAMRYTIDLYRQKGLKYYGGGENIEDARQPALFEHHGNKIAFIGCNAKPIGYSTVSETSPGSLHCDMEWMVQQVKELKANGYLPIVTFQHEEYYQYIALPLLQKDFQAVADAGAVIVSGSQAHQPQAFEIRGDAFIHYGLGNLFFDQTNQGEPPRWEFIDRHVIYAGKHISTELLTAYLEDYARPRPMTNEERQNLLETIFQASGW